MKTKILGNTGVEVSRLCLGGLSFGSPTWRPWVLDERAARPIIHRAVELGINFFDTSDSYSNGQSEQILGKCLRECANFDELVIATKVFIPSNDRPNMGGLSRKHIQQACDASLKRLGVDTIDLYQIHRLDPLTPMEETLRALETLITQGKIRYIGASSMYAWELMKALATSDTLGVSRFASMQNHYNLIYREEEREMIPLCIDQNIAVNPWSPLARGLLARCGKPQQSKSTPSKTLRDQSDHSHSELYDQPSDARVIEALCEIANARSKSSAQIALSWLLSQKGVCSPVLGVTKINQLEEAVEALDIELEMEENTLLERCYLPHPVKGLPVAPKRFPASK